MKNSIWAASQLKLLLLLFSPEVCEVQELEQASSEAQGPVQYQCLDCLALFDSPDTWLEHRRTHSRSSTHSNTQASNVSDPTHSSIPEKQTSVQPMTYSVYVVNTTFDQLQLGNGVWQRHFCLVSFWVNVLLTSRSKQHPGAFNYQ